MDVVAVEAARCVAPALVGEAVANASTCVAAAPATSVALEAVGVVDTGARLATLCAEVLWRASVARLAGPEASNGVQKARARPVSVDALQADSVAVAGVARSAFTFNEAAGSSEAQDAIVTIQPFPVTVARVVEAVATALSAIGIGTATETVAAALRAREGLLHDELSARPTTGPSDSSSGKIWL